MAGRQKGRYDGAVERVMNRNIDVPIEALNLSVRAYNVLKRNGLNTVAPLLLMSESDFLALRNLGHRAYAQIIDRLSEHGFQEPPTSRGPDEPEGPNDRDTHVSGVPRRPSPGGLTAVAAATPGSDIA
jgi:hypothetical protein